jgi:hypothetical protein
MLEYPFVLAFVTLALVLLEKDPLEALQLEQQGQVARQEQSSQQGELEGLVLGQRLFVQHLRCLYLFVFPL